MIRIVSVKFNKFKALDNFQLTLTDTNILVGPNNSGKSTVIGAFRALSIALIELYKLRHGSYPETLHDLTFTGDWDAIALNSVTYRRVGNGYQLDITRGWVGQPTLSYPPEFWKGLGLVASNVGGAPGVSKD